MTAPSGYIDFPFKPEGEPASIEAKPPHSVNILSALAENERVVRSGVPAGSGQLRLRGSFILLVTFTSPCTQLRCSRGNTPMVTEGETRFACASRLTVHR